MALGIGARLGPYDVVAPIGAGGMGEVYRARDTRLGRDVAIKVIAETFNGDSDRATRTSFEIPVTIGLRQYDVTGDGQRFLVNSISDESESPVTVVINWTAALRPQDER